MMRATRWSTAQLRARTRPTRFGARRTGFRLGRHQVHRLEVERLLAAPALPKGAGAGLSGAAAMDDPLPKAEHRGSPCLRLKMLVSRRIVGEAKASMIADLLAGAVEAVADRLPDPVGALELLRDVAADGVRAALPEGLRRDLRLRIALPEEVRAGPGVAEHRRRGHP